MTESRSDLASSASLNDEDINDRSSTSTAGPPPDSNQNTGRFGRPSWTFATARQHNSDASSATSSYKTGGERTGSFPGVPASNRTGSYAGHHSRTMSNTSVSVSPMGSSSPQQEWGRSFRLFSTTRHLPTASGSRQRDGGYMYRSTMRHNMNGRTSGVGAENERSAHMNGSLCHQRQSSLFSLTNPHANFGVSAIGHNSLSQEPRLSSIFIAGSPVLGPITQGPASPLFPVSSHAWMHGSGGGVRGVTSVASVLLGGGNNVYDSLSDAQKEGPLLLNSLRAYLALNGKTIIVGDSEHALEIKRGALIAAGGFSKVYAGLNTVKGELVAIKEINIADVDDFKALKAVEQEFALLRSIRHPNIVSYSFFEHSRSQKVCRIVMELLAGDSTLNLLHKYGPLTEVILRKLARHLLAAIAFIHKEGIFHRDIKPANILVSHRGEVKLCDFGCSKRVTELSKASSCIIGTPVYMAPELIRGEADHKADIWSMACSLFELATGILPWYHSGVRDHLPLMFYITTTSETPLVLPAHDNVKEFSSEFLNFMELCFTRDVKARPEATDLLKHPWIAGRRMVMVLPRCPSAGSVHTQTQGMNTALGESPHPQKPPHLSRAGGAASSPHRQSSPIVGAGEREEGSQSSTAEMTLPVTPLAVDDETVCQQELEEVAAVITIDLCGKLMNSQETIMRNLERRHADNTNAITGTSETTLSTPPPSLSQRAATSVSMTDFLSPSGSPEHSILHDNFYYNQMPLGASAGNFVLPADMPEQPQQQYLRINESGVLDFATLPDDDSDKYSSEAAHLRSPSVDSGTFTCSHNSRMLSPARNTSFTPGITTPASSHTASIAQHGRFASPKTLAGSSVAVGLRSESPYRHSGAPSSSALGMATPPLLSRPTPPTSPQCTNSVHSTLQFQQPRLENSLRHSGTTSHESSFHEDEHTPTSPLSTSTQHSTTLRQIQQKSKSQADGKMHMSFVVNTAPGHEVNVDLNIDINDVHCRMVDNRPNYLVAMTDDIREQITTKIKEVAAQSEAASPMRSSSSRTSRSAGNNTVVGPPEPWPSIGSNIAGNQGKTHSHTPSIRSPQGAGSRLSLGSAAQSPAGSVDGETLAGAATSSSTSRASTPAAGVGGTQRPIGSILTPRISPRKSVRKS